MIEEEALRLPQVGQHERYLVVFAEAEAEAEVEELALTFLASTRPTLGFTRLKPITSGH